MPVLLPVDDMIGKVSITPVKSQAPTPLRLGPNDNRAEGQKLRLDFPMTWWHHRTRFANSVVYAACEERRAYSPSSQSSFPSQSYACAECSSQH